MLLTLPLAGLAGAVAITRFHLQGEDLSKYDQPSEPTFTPDADSKGNQRVREYLIENFVKPAAAEGSRAEKLAAKRARFDQAGLRRDFEDCTFQEDVAVISGRRSVTGEWTRVPGADPDRRLLYLHGGANTVGSAISHRSVTWNIARRTGLSVFSANYRLMPENSRMDGIEDARTCYRWLLENGPDGPAKAEKVVVAGDSAGGNLTLSLSNWVRDEGVRSADAVVAISPATDQTFSGPSIRGNYETDIMLKPLAGQLVKAPRAAVLWLMWLSTRISPSDSVVSPVYADLSGLPPTLIHVSSSEMLYDDARRYAVKAQRAGSPVELQSWAHMAHVWHAFDEMLPEAHQAYDEIAKFLKKQKVAG